MASLFATLQIEYEIQQKTSGTEDFGEMRKKSAATAQYEWVELKTILKPFAEQLH